MAFLPTGRGPAKVSLPGSPSDARQRVACNEISCHQARLLGEPQSSYGSIRRRQNSEFIESPGLLGLIHTASIFRWHVLIFWRGCLNIGA